MKQLLGLCAWLNTLCDEDRATTRLYDFVGITFFGHVILRRHDCLIKYAWSIIISYVNMNFYFESFGSEHSCHNKDKLHWEIMLGSIPHQKFCFYHLPTQGRERIKLGDARYVSNVSIIFDCSMLYYIMF